ncbi:hypothetical protein KAJ83_03210 [Marivibrio halodurans]|uniref:Uncharacterized protein n=1 Tax=Marivibrio halodurans TaxID=2039722 RepID=A0A8J7V1N6_9PROT|nr:hypothetical protein [Marivibrio halodurans]MBP5856002.1 hypothetical protein [Marivibrio halodurans]
MCNALQGVNFRRFLPLLPALLFVPVLCGTAHSKPLRSLGEIPVAASPYVERALQDLNRLLEAEDATFDPAQGTICPGGPDELARAAVGPTAYERTYNTASMRKFNEKAIRREVVLSMIDGECPRDGLLNGPVEMILRTWTVSDIQNGMESDSLLTYRTSSVFVNGEPVGDPTYFNQMRNTIYQRLLNGERVERRFTEDAAETYYGAGYGGGWLPDGRQTTPTVGFSVGSVKHIVSVSVVTPDPNGLPMTESYHDGALSFRILSIDAHHTVMESFHEGRLAGKIHMKDGDLHGWQEIYAEDIPTIRNCYQHGEIVKAVDCPSD